MLDTLKTFSNAIIEKAKTFKGDWNENDTTSPNYIKNRPFYTNSVEKILVEESVIEFVENNGAYIAEYPSSFEATVGNTYKISWDGNVYECTCVYFEDMLILGNPSIEGSGGPDTGEPFLICVLNGQGMMIATLDASASHTVSISSLVTNVVKIDEKYLPQKFVKQSDFEVTLENKVDKVSGKGLSTNDYTTAEKNKLAGVEPGATKIVVDNSLSTTSINPVQNLTIAYALNQKANAASPNCHGSFSLNRKSNTIVGQYSCAEGYDATASGDTSHAEGHYTTASGNYSHAEGHYTTASGNYSHAEGHYTTASGHYSHAEGYRTTASGHYSHAEGYGDTTASGESSHAEGYNTTASGSHSHAEGHGTTASGKNSHASGEGTIAAKFGQCVIGKYNIEDVDTITDPVERNLGKYVFVVGNGYFTSRSNAHTLDWSGNAWYAGTVEGTAMIVKSSTAGSSKRFKITVDDSGTISATEITT